MNKTEYQDLKAEMIKELYPGLEGDPEWLLRTMASDAGPESLALSLVAINGGFEECQQSLLVSLMSSAHMRCFSLKLYTLGMLH